MCIRDSHTINRPIRNGRRISDLDWYIGYRDLVAAYPTFLHLEHFDGWKLGMPLPEWTTPLFNAAAYEGFVSMHGLAYWNSVDEDGKRFTKKVATLQLTFPKSEIYCQLIDVSETDVPEVPMIKILMIHNPKKANPYGLRRFVKNLRFILIEKRGYDFAWGCPLEVDDPRYPVVGVDKRFEMHRELTFADEGGEEYENAKAELNVVMNVEIQDIVLRIRNEVMNPSPVTLISAVVTLLIVVLGVQNRRNRRRWVDEFDEEEFDEDKSMIHSKEFLKELNVEDKYTSMPL